PYELIRLHSSFEQIRPLTFLRGDLFKAPISRSGKSHAVPPPLPPHCAPGAPAGTEENQPVPYVVSQVVGAIGYPLVFFICAPNSILRLAGRSRERPRNGVRARRSSGRSRYAAKDQLTCCSKPLTEELGHCASQ